jgi:hypothetical protein
MRSVKMCGVGMTLLVGNLTPSNYVYRILQKYTNFVRLKVFTAVAMKNGVFWDVTPYALVRTEVSEELSASFIRVTRIGELEQR